MEERQGPENTPEEEQAHKRDADYQRQKVRARALLHSGRPEQERGHLGVQNVYSCKITFTLSKGRMHLVIYMDMSRPREESDQNQFDHLPNKQRRRNNRIWRLYRQNRLRQNFLRLAKIYRELIKWE